MKDVTIVIPSFNEKKHIEQALLSALEQAEFVIVSDNCSTDGTQSICKRLASKFENLIFYEQTENLGSANNLVFLYSKVKTKFVMHMGAHDILEKNYVAELKQCLEESPDAVLAYPCFVLIDDNGKEIGTYDAAELLPGIASPDTF